MFRALALRRIRSDEGLTLETSAFESVYGVNSVDKAKLSCNTLHQRSTTVSLAT